MHGGLVFWKASVCVGGGGLFFQGASVSETIHDLILQWLSSILSALIYTSSKRAEASFYSVIVA